MQNETISPNGQNAPASDTFTPAKRYGNWPLIILAALFIIVPFLAWYSTWFGRNLSDEDIARYLADEENPRHIQHALTQVEARIEKGDGTARKFYPQIVSLASSPHTEIRKTAAWVMGQDNASEEFHRGLLKLLTDSEPLVRRNAALQLVRFGDAAGRPELRAMLQPFEVKSPMAGTIVSILGVGSKIRAGALMARIRVSNPISNNQNSNRAGESTLGSIQEFRSPLDGEIAALAVKEGDSVTSGKTIASLNPDQGSIQDALRALAYVGTPDDLSLIENYKKSGTTELNQSAAQAADAIRIRDARGTR